MKLKYIVAVLGLVASAASQAALTIPDATGHGDVALVVWDANSSYTLDLGLSYNQFLAGANTSSTLATLSSANWNSFATAEAANVGTWQYAVIDAHTDNAGLNGAILGTVNSGYVGTIAANYFSTDVETAFNQIAPYYQAVNTTGTHPTAADGDSYNLKGTPAYFETSGMDTFNGTVWSNSNAVGTVSAIEVVTRGSSDLAAPTEQALAGTMNLSQTGGSYVLSYNVAAVPEAPGVSMGAAGLALLGFMTLRRRNNRA